METKKNFVINTAFYAILAALALAFWKYLLPILMPFVIGFIIASIVQLPLNALHLKSKRATTPAAVVLCIVFYALLIWGMVFKFKQLLRKFLKSLTFVGKRKEEDKAMVRFNV